MDRNDDRGPRTRRSRVDSNEELYNDTASLPTSNGEPRRRRSQAARLREDTMSMETLGEVPEDTITPPPMRESRGITPPPPPPPVPRGRGLSRGAQQYDDMEDTLTPRRGALDAQQRYGRPDAQQTSRQQRVTYSDDNLYADDDYDAYEDVEPVGRKDKKAAKQSRRADREETEYDDYDEAPRGRKQASRYDDEDEYEDYEEEDENDASRRKRRIIRWSIIIGVIVLLLASATFIGLNNPDLIEPVVQWGRGLIQGATPTPVPTLEPTPEPIITPEPAPDVSAAVVVSLMADPAEQPDINQPVTFKVITSTQTNRVRIVNDNGETLIEGIEGDYTDTEDLGRQWHLMVYFIAPYEGSVEAYPGNDSGWNEASGSRIPIKVGESSATGETAAVGEGGGTLQVDAGTQAASVQRAGLGFDKAGALDTYSRAKSINLGDAKGYVGENGMNGVLTFRGSGLRQNAAYGTVAPTEMKLESVWTANSGSAGSDEYAFGAQPIIVQWHANIRDMMALNESKAGKSKLKEVIFAGSDGSLYFYDLDDGIATRDPISGEKEVIPMYGTPSVYPMGVPLIAVGTGNPADPSAYTGAGLMLVNLIKNTDIGSLNGRNDNALSTNATIITSPLIDNGADTVLSAGGNGLLYAMYLSTGIDNTDGALTIKPDVTIFRTGEEGEDVSIDSSLAGYGSYVYYASNGGVLSCIDVNTYEIVWSLNVGADSDAAPALDVSEGGTILYHATKSDVEGLAHMRRIDAATGEVLWDRSVPGSINASPVVGTGELSGMIVFAATNSEAGGTVYALDAQSGNLLWEYVVVGANLSSPIALYGESGGSWIVQGDEGGLLLLDATSGERMDYLVLDGGIYGSPAAYGDMIVVATETGKLHGVRIK